MIWTPHVTVAAVVEHEGRYLLAEEYVGGTPVLNQPAGHWEQHETLIEGARRETLEETGYDFRPTALVGIYRWPHPAKGITYLRFAFAGEIIGFDPTRPLDANIVRTVWLTPEEIRAQARQHRSPLVGRCVEDHLAGRRYSLELLTHLE